VVIVLIAAVIVSAVLVYAFVYAPEGSHLVVLNGNIFTSHPEDDEKSQSPLIWWLSI
jgi:hypothetical protein